MTRYKVELDSCGNPDYGENPYDQIDGAWTQMVHINSIEEAQQVVREYIAEHNLGSGNWNGGNVWNEQNEYIGCISYNGRFWDKDTPYGKLEIQF